MQVEIEYFLLAPGQKTLPARYEASMPLFVPILLSSNTLLISHYAQNYAHKFNENKDSYCGI